MSNKRELYSPPRGKPSRWSFFLRETVFCTCGRACASRGQRDGERDSTREDDHSAQQDEPSLRWRRYRRPHARGGGWGNKDSHGGGWGKRRCPVAARRLCVHAGGRKWGHMSMPRIADSHQKLGETQGKGFPSEPSEGAKPAYTVMVRFWPPELGDNKFQLF